MGPDPKTATAGPTLQRLFWTRRTSLTVRILTVNIVAFMLLAGSLVYLDSYRHQLLTERLKYARIEVQITAEALAIASPQRQHSLMVQLGREQRLRLRLYDEKGDLAADSFQLAQPSFRLVDPTTEPLSLRLARLLDLGMDALLGATPVPPYREPATTSAWAWPELRAVRDEKRSQVTQRYAPNRTPVISATAPVGNRGGMLMIDRNATDITENVRNARQTLAIIIAVALVISIQLSLFLARTIVQPLRVLVRAAVGVRLGRDRHVEVPRMPERRDEIGMLARAISDMTEALRQRIDAVDSFAADVAHEIKNPLASLRSALESLEKVEDHELRVQLTGIALHDLRRIDRLVTEISDASRIDAELSRATFEPVDMAALVANVIGAREKRTNPGDCRITLHRGSAQSAMVMGVPARLERVIENLLDNAASFSPPGGEISVVILVGEGHVETLVCDEGPGIPESERQAIFARFHSVRPETERFGDHSGLGLAIARTIADAHDGSLDAGDRPDGIPGACLRLRLPMADRPMVDRP